jgi:hypothetical protein
VGALVACTCVRACVCVSCRGCVLYCVSAVMVVWIVSVAFSALKPALGCLLNRPDSKVMQFLVIFDALLTAARRSSALAQRLSLQWSANRSPRKPADLTASTSPYSGSPLLPAALLTDVLSVLGSDLPAPARRWSGFRQVSRKLAEAERCFTLVP